MNKKELTELRRRLKPDRSNIGHIYGCYVNGSREIISTFDESLGLLSKEESEKYVSLLKKSLSGSLGRTLMNLSFDTRQVVDSDEHRLLSALRSSALKDEEIRSAFYKCVTEALDMKGENYLILLAYDVYDVPQYNAAGDLDEDSSRVYSYVICSVCPVKTGKSVLGYSKEDERFENLSLTQVVAQPEMGFLFPAFDDRAANIYSALFYSRSTKEVRSDFIDAVFKTKLPMSPAQQKETFNSAVADTLKKECSFELMKGVHSSLRQIIETHKELKDPEPLVITVEEAGEILEKNGMPESEYEPFLSECKEKFGSDAAISPENIIPGKKMEIHTGSVKISADPEFGNLIKTGTVNGKKYLLIPLEGDIELNGMKVKA